MIEISRTEHIICDMCRKREIVKDYKRPIGWYTLKPFIDHGNPEDITYHLCDACMGTLLIQPTKESTPCQ